jgi:transposase InsO family protein
MFFYNNKHKEACMQTKGLPKNLYNLYAYARKQETLDAYRAKYQWIVDQWHYFKQQGVSTKLTQEIVGYSRATYYRAKKVLADLDRGILPPSKLPKRRNKPQWGESEKQRVLQIRRANPTYGKAKIGPILRRDHGLTISDSTVGRILKHLMTKGLITRSRSAVRTRKKRQFNKGHAQPWTFKDHNAIAMGERVQIDHMTVTKNQVSMKHFQAWDRRSRFMHAQVYSHAKSRSAKQFLEELLQKAPFPMTSIQVDGGSEFRDEFEKACADYEIPLMVLPPSKPQYNDGVERGNRIFREEFYDSNLQADSLGAIRNELAKAVKKYNEFRPHHGLKGLTPMQYINNSHIEAVA